MEPKLLIPPDPLAGIDRAPLTEEEYWRLRELHNDWIWKWKPWRRGLIDDGFSCQDTYGRKIPDVLEPHEYDLVDYFGMRKERFAHTSREDWE